MNLLSFVLSVISSVVANIIWDACKTAFQKWHDKHD